MIAIIQRVTSAKVEVAGEIVGRIGPGLAALVAVHREDGEADVSWMARKLVELRVFRNAANPDKHFDLDVKQSGGAILLVSNFTVAAATRKGRRPSFDAAAGGEAGEKLFNRLVEEVRGLGVEVATGRFGADMAVAMVNDGPATFILHSRE